MIKNKWFFACQYIYFFLCFVSHIYAQIVLVTGGAGFIGSHVAQRLLQRGDTVIIIDNFNDAYDIRLKKYNIFCVEQSDVHNKLHIHKIDTRDKDALEKIFVTYKPDVICHLAGRAGVRGSIKMPEEYVTSNIVGTLNIFELAKKYPVSHVVYASSSSVYGNCKKAPFTENLDISHPTSSYAMTKGACELLAYTYYHLFDIHSTGLRFFTVYGPRGRIDMAPFIFVDAIHNNKMVHVYGDGSAIRDFTYIDDIVDGVIRAIDTPLKCEIINLGRGEPIVLIDFINTIEKIIGEKAHLSFESAQRADVAMTHADISKSRELLGYNPRIHVRDGMQKMYDWYVNEYALQMKRMKLFTEMENV